ncbi:hypothetical protein Tco_0489301 [Tanacetum coccineum]
MDEEFTITAYPNVQENLKLPTKDQFFVEKPQEEEIGKTNAEAEVHHNLTLPLADFQEHTIAAKDFKNLYPSDFEDLNLLLLQGHLDHLPGSDKRMLSTVVKL